jgi:myosin heavy subunit
MSGRSTRALHRLVDDSNPLAQLEIQKSEYQKLLEKFESTERAYKEKQDEFSQKVADQDILLQEANQRVHEAELKVVALEKQVEQSGTENYSLQEQLDKARGTFSHEQAKTKKLEDKVRSLQTLTEKYRNLSIFHNKETAKLKTALEEVQSQKYLVEQKLSEIKSDAEELKSNNLRLQDINANLIKQRDNSEYQASRSDEKCLILNQEIEGLTDQIEKLNETNRQLKLRIIDRSHLGTNLNQLHHKAHLQLSPQQRAGSEPRFARFQIPSSSLDATGDVLTVESPRSYLPVPDPTAENRNENCSEITNLLSNISLKGENSGASQGKQVQNDSQPGLIGNIVAEKTELTTGVEDTQSITSGTQGKGDSLNTSTHSSINQTSGPSSPLEAFRTADSETLEKEVGHISDTENIKPSSDHEDPPDQGNQSSNDTDPQDQTNTPDSENETKADNDQSNSSDNTSENPNSNRVPQDPDRDPPNSDSSSDSDESDNMPDPPPPRLDAYKGLPKFYGNKEESPKAHCYSMNDYYKAHGLKEPESDEAK